MRITDPQERAEILAGDDFITVRYTSSLSYSKTVGSRSHQLEGYGLGNKYGQLMDGDILRVLKVDEAITPEFVAIEVGAEVPTTGSSSVVDAVSMAVAVEEVSEPESDDTLMSLPSMTDEIRLALAGAEITTVSDLASATQTYLVKNVDGVGKTKAKRLIAEARGE